MINIYICIKLYVCSLHSPKGKKIFAVLGDLCIYACVRVCVRVCLINDDMWQTFDVNSVNVNLNINGLSPLLSACASANE